MTSDPTLVVLAHAGDEDGYEQLHRRHAPAAWGLAQAITRDDETALAAVAKAIPAVFAAIDRGDYPHGVPVRRAILGATRVAAISTLHSSTWTGAPQGRDAVDRAFSGLPECWRSALWLAEVEGLRPVESARPLRMTPGDAAALTERARAGFTDRYLRLAAAGRDEHCRAVLRLLPTMAAGALAPHQTAEVDQHLAGCRPCRVSSMDLADLGSTLRRITLPVPATVMRAPAPARSHEEPTLHVVLSLAAVIVALLGFASVAVMTGDAPKVAEQVAAPIEVDAPARDPGLVRSLATPIAGPAAVSSEVVALPKAPTAAPAPDNADVVAMARPHAVAADLSPSATSSTADHAPAATPAPITAPSPPPPAPAPPPPPADGGADDTPEPDEPVETPSLEANLDAGMVGASVSVDLASSQPAQVDVSIPGPVGLSALGSGV